MSCGADADAAFQHVVDMEPPMTTVADLLRGLGMIAETLEADAGAVVQRLAWLALRECEAAEALRSQLFKLTHPERAHFERAGWPA